MNESTVKIAYLLTGNELMSGDTVDTNSSYLSQSLRDIGLQPRLKQIVGDDLNLLVDGIRQLTEAHDVLVINGGLGPTQDDLTTQALALAAQVPLHQHPEALRHLEQWAQRRGFVLTPSNLTQAELPEGCDVLDNPHGSAVGFALEVQGCLVLCTPGVPSEFKPMVESYLLPRLKQHLGQTETTQITRLRLFGISESGLQDIVDAEFDDWPDSVELGFRVQFPVLELKVMTHGESRSELNQHWSDRLRHRFADHYLGDDDTTLVMAHNSALRDHGLTVTTVESCTGGLIASMVTSEAGSSSVFEAGYVTYSNTLKQRMVGVDEAILAAHGAVSEPVVIAMARGALERSGAQVAIAVSGIAGPAGGSEQKPVGTVWLAFGAKNDLRTRRLFIPMGRAQFQRMVAAMGLDLVRRFVLGLPTDVEYYSELRGARAVKPAN